MKRCDNKDQILQEVSHYFDYPQESTAHEPSQQSSSSRDHPPSSSSRAESARGHSSSSLARAHSSSSRAERARGHSPSSRARAHSSSSRAETARGHSYSARDNRHMSQVTPHHYSVSNSLTDYSQRMNNNSSSASTSQGGRHYSDSYRCGWGTSSSTHRSSQSVGSSVYNEGLNDFMHSTSRNNRVGF